MSHAHRRMHRRWSGKIPRRGGPFIYANRKTVELLRRERGDPPRDRRWRKREARRQWRARHRRMLNEALAILDRSPGTVWHGIPIRMDGAFW